MVAQDKLHRVGQECCASCLGISISTPPKFMPVCIYDETLYEQFKTAMSRLEAIAVDDWPGVDVSEPALAEVRAAEYA